MCAELADSATELCSLHGRALQNVKDAFSRWTLAYGNLQMSDFLERLEKLDGTGQRAREIVKFLRDRPEILQ